MAVRKTIERILRDDNDQSGQSIREWKIEVEGSHVTVRPRENLGFLLLRAEDVNLLCGDLMEAVAMSSPTSTTGKKDG